MDGRTFIVVAPVGRIGTSPTVGNAARAEELASEQTTSHNSGFIRLTGTVHYAVNQEMEYRKMCARWVA